MVDIGWVPFKELAPKLITISQDAIRAGNCYDAPLWLVAGFGMQWLGGENLLVMIQTFALQMKLIVS